MKKYLLFIGMMVICNLSYGQLLKKLKDKITTKTEQKVDAKADRTIDSSLDSILDAKSPVKVKNSSKDGANEKMKTHQKNSLVLLLQPILKCTVNSILSQEQPYYILTILKKTISVKLHLGGLHRPLLN